MAARRKRGRGIGTLFVIFGVVAVIGGTFTAGFLSGRHWERVRVVTGLVKPQAGKEPPRDRAGAMKPSDTPPMPPMTFYQELTAPLAAPPPRPAKADARPAKTEPVAKVEAPAKAELPRPEPAPKADAPTPHPDVPAPAKPEAAKVAAAPAPAERRADVGTGYTVQVAAYATRAQAEALADRLTARGFGADVSETVTQTGVRYRVRVGTHQTKEAARDVLARLQTDLRLSGFVTVR